ncbi:hypothetical protein ACF1AB_13675 [Streptomyces sp. NPDC014846]|uniref:hypothetical protein n=1 Tax=Streptomyces sp. NPDC014846 TaxID=3364922 RepID=UPI0036F50584
MDIHDTERTPVRLCGGAGCAARPHPVAPHSRLCAACERRLLTDLERLPGLYRSCEAALLGSRNGGIAPQGRSTGGPMPGMPFNARAADVRASILSVLGSWSGLVAQERGITAPSRTVTALTLFLRRHASWLAAHETAAEAAAEVGRLVGAARRVVDPDGNRRMEVGSCTETGCTGSLVAHVRTAGPAGSEIVCSAEPAHRWPAAEWTRLGRHLDEAGAAGTARRAAQWLSAADVARLRDVPPGTVYRLASEHRWRRDKRAGRTYYWAQDVENSFHAMRRTARTG